MANENEETPQELQDAPPDPIVTALVKVNVTEKVLTELEASARALEIAGPEDKEGYEKVRRHRLDIVPIRTKTTEVMKALRADALEYQRKVKAKEDEIVGRLQTIEGISKAKEEKYLADRQAIEDAKAKAEQDRVDGLLAQLRAFEWNGNPYEVAQDTPAMFADRLAKAEADFKIMEAGRRAEAERKEREEREARELAEANRKEAERLENQRQEQEAEQRRIDAQKAELEASQRRIQEEADKAEKARLQKIADDAQAEADKLRREKEATQAKIDAQARADAEEAQRKAEADRLAALAPDKEKIARWLTALEAFMATPPEIADKALAQAVKSFRFTFTEMVDSARRELK
jgi:hypothetical protein